MRLSVAVDLDQAFVADAEMMGDLVQHDPPHLAAKGFRIVPVQALERAGVITGYRAEIDPRALGYQLTAIVRIKPAPGQLQRIPELALEVPEVSECHRITGEDCFFLKVHLRSIEELGTLLDRFLAYGETTTSLINASPIPRRDPPLEGDE